MKRPPMRYPHDLTGRRFGRLTVIERTAKPEFYSRTGAWWMCQCDCGAMKAVDRKSLINSNTNSCGCLRSELATQRNRKRSKK